MCGISGFHFYSDHRPAVDRHLIERMTDALSHRGPDSAGYYVNGRVALGHRRLSIIDLEGGAQPVHNEDKSVWVVFNGEIYNYQSLRDELLAQGHTFYTNSDTETIVHLYEELGESFVHRLRGMFALALWDDKRRKLLLARDRLGIKPLFYRLDNGSLSFASEIKALLRDPSCPTDINWEAFDHFLSLSYIPAPHTIFRDILKLPPAHLLVIENATVQLKRYWTLEFHPDTSSSPARLEQRTLELLHEAVKLHLISDVPLGVFLSGGIDSSALVAIMSGLRPEPANTFSVGYSEAGTYFDELPYARLVAERYHAAHHELIVTPRIEQALPQIIGAFDEPFADPAIVPFYYICAAAKHHVRVALSGLGGDELFGGYERYSGLLLSARHHTLLSFLGRLPLSPLLRHLPEPRGGSPTLTRLRKFLQASGLPPDERYISFVLCFDPADKARLLAPDLAAHLSGPTAADVLKTHFNTSTAPDLLHKAIDLDLHTYLPDSYLAYADRLSMMHSLEVRVPFLDHVLLEFAATIPAELKVRGHQKKLLLIKAMRDKLPADILHRRKTGFAAPFVQWFRGGLKELTFDLLSPERIRKRGYFNPSAVSHLLDQHLRRQRNRQRQILALLALELWCQQYVDSRPT